jgi:hypothetical protein
MPPVLCGLVSVLGSSLLASCLHAPMSWSPDGRWLAYTTIERAGCAELRPGWLFEISSAAGVSAAAGARLAPEGHELAARYKIWATERGTLSSVLIEESRGPLSSPSWSPDGRSLSYMRFVPRSPLDALTPARGTCEVVVQEALDRKRVVYSFKNLELDKESRGSFPELLSDWSPDGQFLAVPRPGRVPSVLVIRVDGGEVVRTLESASGPSWSPDGSKLAFYRPGRPGTFGQVLQVLGFDSGALRPLLELTEGTERPVWSADGQSILAIARRPGAHGREVDLVRVGIESGFATRILPLGSAAPDAAARGRMLSLAMEAHGPAASRRASLSCDREGEEFVLSIDVEGQLPLLRYGNLRRGIILKPFHPIDQSLRIGSLAVPPDSQVVAVRIDTPGGLGLPLLCDLASETVRLIAPDRSTRLEWTVTLVGTARSLLSAALPQAVVDRRSGQRTSILPIPGEIVDQSPFMLRLRRLGKIGDALLEQPEANPETSAGLAVPMAGEEELRFFFDALRGDHAAAEADLGILESRATSPDTRLRILGLRAQELAASGQMDRAMPIVDYLVKSQGARARVVEETPAGPVVTGSDDATSTWPRYLATLLEHRTVQANVSPEEADEAADPALLRRLGGAIRGPGFDGGGVPQIFRGGGGPDPMFPGQIGVPFDPVPQPRFFPPAPPRPVRRAPPAPGPAGPAGVR